MKFTKIECPSCSAKLDIDLKKKKHKCEYCDTVFVIDKEKDVVIQETSELKKKIAEIKEKYNNGNRTVHLFEDICDLALDYPSNIEVLNYLKIIGTSVVDSCYNDENFDSAIYVAERLHSIIPDDKEIEEIYIKVKLDYYKLNKSNNSSEYEKYDRCIEFIDFYSKYENNIDVKKLYNEYLNDAIKLLREYNDLDPGRYKDIFDDTNLTIDNISEAFPNNDEIKSLIDSYKQREEEYKESVIQRNNRSNNIIGIVLLLAFLIGVICFIIGLLSNGDGAFLEIGGFISLISISIAIAINKE